MCLSVPSSTAGHHFVEQAYNNCKDANLPCQRLTCTNDITAAFRSRCTVPVGTFDEKIGYLNPTGGWAESGRSLEVAIRMVRQLGGVVRSGFEVVGLVKEGKNVKGVKVRGEEDVMGDLVVVSLIPDHADKICAGAWTPALCASEGMNIPIRDVVATGQSVATIQLTPDEQVRYAKVPVVSPPTYRAETGIQS